VTKQRFEVQEWTLCDGWINNWQEEIKNGHGEWEYIPTTYETFDDAQAAIYEFFANLYRAGMGHAYHLDDYRIVLSKPIDTGAVNE